MTFWDVRRAPRIADAMEMHAHGLIVQASKALKLERWRSALSQAVSYYEQETPERASGEPMPRRQAAAMAKLGVVVLELRWRRQGPDGPFR